MNIYPNFDMDIDVDMGVGMGLGGAYLSFLKGKPLVFTRFYGALGLGQLDDELPNRRLRSSEARPYPCLKGFHAHSPSRNLGWDGMPLGPLRCFRISVSMLLIRDLKRALCSLGTMRGGVRRLELLECLVAITFTSITST